MTLAPGAISSSDLGRRAAHSVIRRLRVSNFKNFADAELLLGPFAVLIGANASGKSNVRDALRFLHGVSRGYSVPEIIGEKWIEGGVLQWRGIRGGTREVAFNGGDRFTLEVELELDGHPEPSTTYAITVDVGDRGRGPRVVSERLLGPGGYGFDSNFEGNVSDRNGDQHVGVQVPQGGTGRHSAMSFPSSRPVLTQIVENKKAARYVREQAERVIEALSSMRFLDLSPDAMRIPSIPGQVVLGDRGENLSSVLQAITADPALNESLVEWVQELTPMDAAAFEFPADLAGRILVSLVEEQGRVVSAHSASDGTLRFLAMMAALLGPEPARLYFFEEIENGIHPARLYLLIQLIEQSVQRGSIQVIATSHSPQLLSLLKPASREHASLVYRAEGEASAHITRILDLPAAHEVFKNEDLAVLHSTGWFEHVAEPPENGRATG